MKTIMKRVLSKNPADKEWTRTIFFDDGYTVATDGHMVIRVQGEQVYGKKISTYPEIAAIGLDKIAIAKILTNSFKTDIDVLKKEHPCHFCSPDSKNIPYICPKCKEKGVLKFNDETGCYNAEETSRINKDGIKTCKVNTAYCAHCKGSRIAEENKIFDAGTCHVDAQYLDIALQLPGIEFCEMDDTLGFKFHGGDGAIMALRAR